MASVIQILGLGLMTTGIMMVSIPLGLLAAGAFAVLVGVSIERNK